MAQQLKDLKFTDSVATPSSVASQITEQVTPMISCAVEGKRDKSDTSFAQVNVVCTAYQDTGIRTPDATYKYDQSDNGIARLVDVKAVQLWASTQHSCLVGVTDRLSSQKQDKLTAGENICINGSVISAGTAAVDAWLDSTSPNPVQNKVVTVALEGKQDKLTIATTVASGDGNPVSGGAVHDALQGKQDTLTAGTNITITGNVISATGGGGGGGSVTVDNALSNTSTNPIQNQWLGKRMGATNNNSVQIGYDARAGMTGGTTIDNGDDGYQVAVGLGANGSSRGVAVGYSAAGSTYGVAVGSGAGGHNYGAAVGHFAAGNTYGVAVGYCASGSVCGVAVGHNANGYTYGAAVGSEANGANSGAAVGSEANGANSGAAVGHAANTNSTKGAVAVGYQASADSNTPIVIGGSQLAATAQITVSKTGVLKVGGKEISGGGSDITVDNSLVAGSTNPVQSRVIQTALAAKQDTLTAGTNITITGNVISATGGGGGGSVAVDDALLDDSTNPLQNQWLGKRMGATSSNSVEIGYNAKAGKSSGQTVSEGDDGNQVAVGSNANGTAGGAAVGNYANGNTYGAAVGWSAQGYTYGAAVGHGAGGYDYGVAVGYCAAGFTSGAAVGVFANGSSYGAAVGREAKTNSTQGAVAIGYQASADSATPVVIGGSQLASTAQITVSSAGVLKVGGKEISGGGGNTEVWNGTIDSLCSVTDDMIGAKPLSSGNYPRLHARNKNIHGATGFSNETDTHTGLELLLPWDVAMSNETSYLMAGVKFQADRGFGTQTYVQPLVPKETTAASAYFPYALPAFEDSPVYWKGHFIYSNARQIHMPWDKIAAWEQGTIALTSDIDAAIGDINSILETV